jgi:hypothetical protein
MCPSAMRVSASESQEREVRARSSVSTWGSVTSQILALRDHLRAEQVTFVVTEATGDDWKPNYAFSRTP